MSNFHYFRQNKPSTAIKNSIFIGIFILWAANSCQHVESRSMVVPSMDYADLKESAFYSEFNDYLRSQLTDIRIPGAAVVIVKDGYIAYMKGFGFSKVGSDEKIDANTVFRLGSLSKGFSGVLAAKLIEDGHFNWNDKVVEFVPDFTLKDPDHANRLSVKNILSHATGIGRHAYTNLIDDGMSLDGIIPRFATLKPYGKEG